MFKLESDLKIWADIRKSRKEGRVSSTQIAQYKTIISSLTKRAKAKKPKSELDKVQALFLLANIYFVYAKYNTEPVPRRIYNKFNSYSLNLNNLAKAEFEACAVDRRNILVIQFEALRLYAESLMLDNKNSNDFTKYNSLLALYSTWTKNIINHVLDIDFCSIEKEFYKHSPMWIDQIHFAERNGNLSACMKNMTLILERSSRDFSLANLIEYVKTVKEGECNSSIHEFYNYSLYLLVKIEETSFSEKSEAEAIYIHNFMDQLLNLRNYLSVTPTLVFSEDLYLRYTEVHEEAWNRQRRTITPMCDLARSSAINVELEQDSSLSIMPTKHTKLIK